MSMAVKGRVVLCATVGCEKSRLCCVATWICSVTAGVQSDQHLHGYTLPVFFATD